MYTHKKDPSVYKMYVLHPVVNVMLEARFMSGNLVVTGITLMQEKIREPALKCSPLEKYSECMLELLEGSRHQVNDLPLDLSFATPFQRRVLAAAQSIAWGTAVSYAGLAAMAGSPGAARAAASVMRNNRFPLAIPCHRVIKSDGTIGGFMGRVNGCAIDLKRKLLAREGCYPA